MSHTNSGEQRGTQEGICPVDGHEVSPSQHELDLRHTDALTMADNIMTTRLTVKEVALEHGIYATFMPKPLEKHDGSGMHLHLSLFQGDENAFHEASGQYGLSKVARGFIAGKLRHSSEIKTRMNLAQHDRLQRSNEVGDYGAGSSETAQPAILVLAAEKQSEPIPCSEYWSSLGPSRPCSVSASSRP
jgi:glutamine synthetase type III